jgi:A/G-specific adenine glycosylase
MLALPTSEWRESRTEAPPPLAADWRRAGEVEHVFTHFALTLQVWRAEGDGEDLIWTSRAGLQALPSVFLKAARMALGEGATRPGR